jgi:uncharacterized membrane protein YgdD (TMEM256/DUF423 family)
MRVDPTDAGPSGASGLDRRVRALAAAGALFGFIGVAAGAFGAHALKSSLSADRLAVFDTAARYEQIHALALLATASILHWRPGRAALAAGMCFVAGILFFSGSLFALVLLDQPRWGLLTPFGGISLMAGWLLLAWSVTKRNI